MRSIKRVVESGCRVESGCTSTCARGRTFGRTEDAHFLPLLQIIHSFHLSEWTEMNNARTEDIFRLGGVTSERFLSHGGEFVV